MSLDALLIKKGPIPFAFGVRIFIAFLLSLYEVVLMPLRVKGRRDDKMLELLVLNDSTRILLISD